MHHHANYIAIQIYSNVRHVASKLAGLSWLASLGPPERVGAMPTVYGIWCPWGDKCSKRSKLLAKHTDEETVRSMLLNRLQSSPYHHDERRGEGDCCSGGRGLVLGDG